MKILYLVPSCLPRLGGSEVFLDRLLAEVGRAGHRALVLAPCRPSECVGGIAPRLYAGNRLIRFPFQPQLLYRFGHGVYALLLGALMLLAGGTACAIFRPGIIHTSGPVCAAVGLILARVFRCRAFGTTHGQMFSCEHARAVHGGNRRLLSWVYRNQDLVFCSGKRSRKEMIEELRVPRGKAILYTYWVPWGWLECHDPNAHVAPFVCLFAGRFIPGKGIDLILDAARILLGGPDADRYRFWFAGAGNPTYRKKIQELERGTQGRVWCVGKLTPWGLVEYYLRADILLAPSVNLGESYNISVIEALACGCAVVCSDTGGMSETVNMNGMFFHERGQVILQRLLTPERLAEGIRWVAANSLGHRKVRRDYAKRYFSAKNAEAILREYKDRRNETKCRFYWRNW